MVTRKAVLLISMGDRISSVRALGSAEVTVFRDSDWRGRSARFIGDVRNLSSLRVF